MGINSQNNLAQNDLATELTAQNACYHRVRQSLAAT
jgi:hypothetical protein